MVGVNLVFHHEVPPPHGETQLAALTQMTPVLSQSEFVECAAHESEEKWEGHVNYMKRRCHAGVTCHVGMTRCEAHVPRLTEFALFSRECAPGHELVLLGHHV